MSFDIVTMNRSKTHRVDQVGGYLINANIIIRKSTRLHFVSRWLKVNQSDIFYCSKMFFTAYVWCSFTFLKLEAKGQTIKKKTLPKGY